MEPTPLPDLAEGLLAKAHESSAGRAAETLHAVEGGRLRQTVIALRSGAALSEHQSPGEATLQVLTGAVRLAWSDGELHLSAGQLAAIPPQRHGLDATEDAVVLLTVALH